MKAIYIDGHLVLTGLPANTTWLIASGHHGTFVDLPYEVAESRFASVSIQPGPVTIRIRSNGLCLSKNKWNLRARDTMELDTGDLPVFFELERDLMWA